MCVCFRVPVTEMFPFELDLLGQDEDLHGEVLLCETAHHIRSCIGCRSGGS